VRHHDDRRAAFASVGPYWLVTGGEIELHARMLFFHRELRVDFAHANFDFTTGRAQPSAASPE
jgi:hypothetical protein